MQIKSITLNHISHALRWSKVFVERAQILSGVQFTRHLIECVVVETKLFVSSNANVILTQQTCGEPFASRHARVTRACLEEANTERWKLIPPSEFAICS